MSTVGERIRQQRKYKGLTQEQLAKAIGVSLMSVRRYESSERTPTEKVLMAISSVLDTDETWLQYGVSEDEFKQGLNKVGEAARAALERPTRLIEEATRSALYSALYSSLDGLTTEELEFLVKYAQFLHHEHEASQLKESDNNAVNSEDDE